MRNTRLFMTTCLLVTGMASAATGNGLPVKGVDPMKPAIATVPPPPSAPTIYTGWAGSRCNLQVWVYVTPAAGSLAANPAYPNYYNGMWFQFGTLANGVISNVTYPPSTYAFHPNTSYTIPVYPSGTTTYYVWVQDGTPGYTLYPASTTLSVTPPCRIRVIKINIGPSPSGAHRTASPENPTEASDSPDLLVKWKLEELNPQTGESVFTLDNPPCWTACNHPGESNSFRGFVAGDASSIAALQAGSCTNTDVGEFDNTKTYRVTRSYKKPDESDWTDYALIMDPNEGFKDKSMMVEMGMQPEMSLAVAADKTHQNAIFTTNVDSGKLHLFDLAGNEMTAIDLVTESYEYGISTNGFAPGVYIVSLESGARTLSKKFVVE